MKIAVLVAPVFNEEDSIGNFLEIALLEAKKLSDVSLQIVVADSHSKDRTKEIVKQIAKTNKNVHFVDSNIPGPGRLGTGLLFGIDYAVNRLQADFVLTMEADLSNDPAQISDFLKRLQRFDVVIGSRYTKGGRILNWSWWRKLLSLGANFVLWCFLGFPKVSEFTNLYRAFKASVWPIIRPDLVSLIDWIFVPAFALSVLDHKLKFTEIPIIYHDRFGGRSKMRTVSYTKNILLYALRERIAKII